MANITYVETLIRRHCVRRVYSCPVCKEWLTRVPAGWLCATLGHTGVVSDSQIFARLAGEWDGGGPPETQFDEVRMVAKEMIRQSKGKK